MREQVGDGEEVRSEAFADDDLKFVLNAGDYLLALLESACLDACIGFFTQRFLVRFAGSRFDSGEVPASERELDLASLRNPSAFVNRFRRILKPFLHLLFRYEGKIFFLVCSALPAVLDAPEHGSSFAVGRL